MLKYSNKCHVCKQKLHLDWWSNWGICGANEEMKELAEEMCIDDLQKDMAADNPLGSTKSNKKHMILFCR